jgi:hypothetical protein
MGSEVMKQSGKLAGQVLNSNKKVKKQRYSFFADIPNTGENFPVIEI